MKNVIKKLMSGVLTLGMIAALMPGMSMEAKAASISFDPSTVEGATLGVDPSTLSTDGTFTVTVTPQNGYTAASASVSAAVENSDPSNAGSVSSNGAGSVNTSGAYTESFTYTAGTGDTGIKLTVSGVAKKNYTITVAQVQNGSATASPTTGKIGDTITITGTPDSGYEFTSANATPGQTVGAVSSNRATFIIVAAAGDEITVTPTFSATSHAIRSGSASGGSISSISPATANTGETVTVTASALDGYRFTGITVTPGNVKQSVATGSNSVTFTVPKVDGDLTVTPEFKRVYSVSTGTATGGSATPSVTEAVGGETVTVTATPDDGYHFVKWEAEPSSVTVSGTKIGTFTMPENDVTITPKFQEDQANDSSATDGEDGSTDGEGTTDGDSTTGEDGQATDGENGEGTGDGDSAAENPFTDVVKSGDDDPYYDAIVWAAKNNVVKGKSETTYDPNGTATRVEFTTMMHRLLKDIVPGNPGTTSKFADCQNLIEDFTNAILWAESLEPAIIQGVDANNFAPNAPITRAQVVTLIWRAAGSPEPKSTTTAFTDLTADYYKKAVAWGVEQGIVKGTSATTFAPDQPVTRAQLATFLYRAVVEAKVFSAAPATDETKTDEAAEGEKTDAATEGTTTEA